MNHNIIITSSMIQNRDNHSIKGCHPSVETHSHHIVRTLQVLLTAIAMLFAVGVQGAWAEETVIGIAPNSAPSNDGCAQTIAPGIVMTWGADTWNAKNNSSGVTVGTSTTFKTYYTGSNNSVAPTNSVSSYSGAIVEFEPEYSGYITVVAYYQKGKKPLIVDETGTAVTGIVNVGADGTGSASVTSGSVLDNNADFNGGLKFPVVAGKKYYVGCSGSKMVGIYGFIYTHDDVSITAAPTITTDLEATTTASYGLIYKFSIKATGNVSSYKWFKDGIEVEGVNGPVYAYVSSVEGTSNVYCQVKNAVGITNSTTCAVSIVRSSEKKLLEARFSNSFLGFIKNNAVNAYYLAESTVPTLESTLVSDYASASGIVDGKITVTAQNETTQDYPVTITSVTPLTVTPGTDIPETTFNGEETWIKTGYVWAADRGWKFSKNADDGRIQDGRTRLYFFVGKSKSVTLKNTGVDSDRDIKVYVNGVEQSGITKIGKSSGNENSITINTSTVDGPTMIAIISNQVGGDGGFTMYSVVAPDAVSPAPAPTPEVIPFSMAEEATTAAAHYPSEWEAGHEVLLPQLPEFTEANTIYINAVAYGASTSSNDNTAAIQAALNAVPTEGGMVVVPAGTWLSGPLTIKSKTVLHFKAGATLKLLPYGNGADGKTASAAGYYPTNGTNKDDKFNYKMFLSCSDNATDIVVEGEGDGSIIDGQGALWWDKRDVLGTRPPLIRFQKGSRFLFRNFKLQNAPGTNLALSNSNGASDFTVHNVTIKNPSSIQSEATADGYTAVSHNTDGIPVWGARVNIYDCLIDTGDDNIVFDSDSQYGHVWHCTFKRGHGASFGSYTERLHHIIYEDITFDGTSAGFRIKTQRGRSGNETCNTDKDGNVVRLNGSVHDIICRNAEMTNVTEPIVLTTHYDQEVDDPEHFASAIVTYQTPEYKDFLFKDITVNSIGNCYSGFNRQRPIYIYGLPELYIHDITFDNVKITGANTAYLAYCRDIHFTNGTTITNTADATSVVGTQYEASWTGSLLPSDLAIADGKGTIAMSIDDEDKALVKGTDYTTSSEGTVTLSSNNEEVVTVVDGKIHAVGAGTAKVTISQAELAANGIYGAGEKEVTVSVTAAPIETTLISFEGEAEEYTDLPEGVAKSGTTAIVNGKIHNSNYYALQLKNGYTTNNAYNNNSIVLTYDGGFKAGDVVKVWGYINNSDASKKGKIDLFTVGTSNATTILASSELVPNLYNDATTNPILFTFTLTEDVETLYLGRNSEANTGTNISRITITGLRAALTASDLAVADGKGNIATTVGDADKALVKGTDYTTSSTGAVNLSSSDEAVATIVDGKIHAVAAGTATITISQAADANYEAGEAVITVNVTAGAERTFKGFELDFTTGGNAADLVTDWSTTGSPTQSGFVFANDGTPSVETTNPTVAVRTYYKNATYGLWLYSAGNDKFTFDVDGPVEITIGQTNQTGSVVVKDAGGNTVIDAFSTNGTTYTYGSSNVISKQYLGDATTLTITGAANDLYVPYIKVMPCDKPDVLPKYNVIFYDADGTSELGSKQVTQGDAIGEITYSATVSTGSKFRRWKDNTGKEVTSANIVSANMNVYACVTPEEITTGEMDYSYDFDQIFFADEHEAITVNNYIKHSSHGWDFKPTSSIAVQVAGPAKIYVGLCQHAGSAKFTLSDGGSFSEEFAATGTDKEIKEITYTGGAGTLTLTSDNQAYLHSFRVLGTAPAEPVGDEVIFSMDVATTVTEKVSFAAGETALTDTYAVITGGTAVVRNGQSGAKDLINAQDEVLYFAMTNGNTNYKVTLTKALAAGDVITADIPNSSTERGLIFSSTKNSTPNPIPDGIVYVNGTSVNSLTYTVKETDTDLVGKTEFYILRSTGTGTYFKNFVITRPAPKPSRTFKDFKLDFRTDPYSVVEPAEGLPDGVSITGSWHDGQHGYNPGMKVVVPVDGAVEFTIGTSAYGAAYTVSGDTGYTNKGETDNRAGEFTKYTTYRYNSEEAATLTFDFSGYVPYFFAKACDYIPQVTVKYYDVDKTTLLETEVVDGSSALAYNTSAVSKVTVADGKKYRGFWKNKANNNRVAEGFTLNENIELYPSVTDIETPTKTSEHTLNLVAAGFEMDEHDLISVSGGSMNAQHGWQLAKDQYMNVQVAGNATITVGLCQYAGGGDLVLQDASGNEVSRVAAKVASDGATHTFIYEGEAGTLKLLATENSTYIHNIKITHTGDLTLPKWDGEKEAWIFATKATNQLNAQELLYAISYVNGQTEHDKTLFIPNGTYDLGTAHNTSIPAGMHLIGESQDRVLIMNQPTEESINQTATFQIDGAGVTLENMTIKCRAPYTTGDGHNAERGVCVEDCGNGSYYVNVTLDGLQDTYYSNGAAGMTATFYNCIVRGNVDFFCGSGNITVNNSRLQIVTTHTSGGTAIICAPATYTTETQGYQFNNCIVEAATSSAVDCLTSGHSSNLKFNLARAWYAGGSATEGKDRTPRVTFTDTEFEIKQAADWGGSIGYAQTAERRVFNIVNTGVQFSDEAMVIDKTNKPFAYATATDRTDPASVSASNITGGGEYDLETIMSLMEAGDGYTPGTTKTINGHKAIVLKSANTTENGKEKRNAMDQTIIDAINNNDIIVLDGAGYNDFVVKSVMTFRKVENKTVVGINGARLCTEWYLTDYFKSILENVPTSSGTGVNSASTAEGTGGDLYDKDGKFIEHIKEEGEYLTRKNLYEAVGNEDYRYSGIFYLGACKNWIIRNLKLVGPGSLDCAGYDLMAIIDSDNGTKFSDHMWVDHCEFIDGMDGNFDITNGSDFVTVSWCKFYYTDRSYAHQNTNLVGSSDDKKAMDSGKLNITFAYNEWGANCRARMPMARFGRIHMLNNYYNCPGNSEYAMNPRIESEFLVEGNYWERGVRRAYNPNGQAAVTWGNNNYYADKAADKAGSSMGNTVTVPYQYSALVLDPHKVPEVLTLNGGAKLYQKPYFTTNLGVADNTPDTQELQHNAELDKAKVDGLVFSVWAENAHTFQWYKQDIALDGTLGEWEMLDGENRNTYTYKPETGIEFNIYCKAFGVSGETESDVLKVKIDGQAAPYYLGGMPEEMQTVYTGSPMTFTANFKDAQGYQWYKSATEDRAGATAIAGATSNTYTYDPAEAEIFYLYCVASNSNGKGDGYSDIVKVKGVYRDVKFHFYGSYNYEEGHSEEVVTGGTGGTTTFHTDCETADTKCKVGLNSMGENALHNKVSAIRFENCGTAHDTDTKYATNTYVEFSLNNALVAGQTIKLSGFQGKTDNPSELIGLYVCTAATKTAENTLVTLKFAQKKNTLEEVEVTVPESLAGATKLYVIPFADRASRDVSLHEIIVYKDEKPADAPTIIVDIDSEYETRVGRELSATIQVEDASAYQWYKNTTNEAVFDEEHKIAGQTSATLSYTTVDSDEGKIYIYCDVTGTKAGSHVTTKVAEVTVLEASNGERGSAKLMWPMVGSDNKNTLVPNAIIVTGDIKNASDVFSKCEDAVLGSMLTNGATKPGKFTDVTEPYAQTIPNTGSASTHLTPGTNASVNQDAYIAYSFTPSVTFKPTNISFKVAMSGTGNGAAQPVLQYGAGASDKKVLADVFIPVRESNNVAQVISSYPISDISIEAGTVATFYIYAGGKIGNDKSFCVRDVIIEGDYVKEIITKCANPTATKGAYDGATQKWTYTLACSTPNSKINYKIGDGEAQLNQSNPVQIALGYGQSFSVWATDPDKKLNDSKTITFTAEAQPVLNTPTYTINTYNTATKKFTVEIAAEDETTILYTINDGDEQTYSDALQLNPADVISAKATRAGYVTSSEAKATMLVPEWPGTEQTLKANGTSNNIGVSYNVGSTWVAGAANNLSDGLKLRTNSKVTKSDASELDNAFRIAVHPGFVIKKIDVTIQSNNESGTHTLDGIFVDEAAESVSPSVALPLTLPMTKATPATTTFTIENIRAKESIDFAFTNGTLSSNQVNAMFTIHYEFIDDLASVTIDDTPLADDKLATLKSTQTLVLDGEFPEDPVVKMTSVLGYEYTIKAGEVDESNNTIFAKSFYNSASEDKNYVIKANVNAVKSPNIEIANEMSLKGGYKVTLKYIEDQEVKTAPYINVDNTGWVAYDPDKEYFALENVQSKMLYGTELESETVARSADCPDNSYEAGKPFAVYLYVNGYSDNQVGTHAYNNESFKTDKIYQAVANQFNVIPLAVDNSKSILDYRSDINDAKLVVITESLGGSGSVEIAGVGNKSTQMALSLKRDVLDKTNVLNMKMFMNGSSSANNLRWQWAQPRAMASELTSIMPCTPDGGGIYEIFGNATMSRDASINLWDDINTENMLYHLQPVFNFNDENESRPIFTPLALVIDPEEPEDQREQYHAIHFYEKNGFQYVAFGLSINEWTQYDNNVYAIIDKIGEMIKDGKPLDSKLTGIVKPTITDNGDGSANVFNNNPNADTYYVVYTEAEATDQSFVAPTADFIITNGTKANDTDFHTQKYTEKMHIFAVSRLGVDAESEVVPGTVEGNSIRYVIRENDDPAAQGMVAKYPFDLTVSNGTFKMPYNQSWKKDGYTVTAWEVVKSSDPDRIGTTIKPGTSVSGLTQDITVKAIWTENTHKITDLSNAENKTQRTVTWEFLQSKGAPALALENKAGNMQAILVGQAKFSDDTFIDVPMTINTDNLATLPDNGTEYHGKFNNTSVNWAEELKTTDAGTFTGSDYAQVRTGTQFTFPAVYGANIVYKQVDLVESVNGEANGNVNRSQVSQSYITDGTKTADVLNTWRFVNPGFQLDANGKVVMVDGKAQLAKTSPMYAAYGEKGRELGLYDEVNGGNHVNGGLIYYQGEATEATLTSMESAQYIHVGESTGKPLGGLNYGSVFMESLSVVYPELYDLKYTVVAVGNEGADTTKSEYDENDELAKIELFSNTHKNAAGRYFLGDKVKMKFTPAYGYEVKAEDVNNEPEVDTNPNYTFIKNGEEAFAQDGMTIQRYLSLDADGKTTNDAKAIDAADRIPVDGAIVDFKMTDLNLTFFVKKVPAVKYTVEAYPSTLGYITFNSGNGRPHKDEYNEFPVGKTIYVTAHPNTGYKFKEWRNEQGEKLITQTEYNDLEVKTGYAPFKGGVTQGDGVMQNPFDPTDFLEKDEMMFEVSTDNNHTIKYVAVFEEGKPGTAHYEFEHALLQTYEGQDHKTMAKLEITADDKNKFPTEASSKALNIPEYYTLFKPGYTLDHWVEIEGEHETNEQGHTPADHEYVKAYKIGTFYYYESEGEVKYLVPVFTKNTTSYDYRATPVDITWDLRVAENAQRMTFKPGVDGTTATTKIYYSTHAKINNGVLIDVPLTITLGKKGKLVNDIEEEDKWGAMGEGTEIVIPSGLGAKFTIATLSKMETTTIDGVVPTSYTVEKIDDADVYLYTYTTTSEATSVTLKIGDDYTYYKYIRAELPSADAVPLTVTENNAAFGTVEIAKVRTTADAVDANNTDLLAKINDTKESVTVGGAEGDQYTLGLGTIVSLHAKRSHLYVLDYFEDGDGNKYYYNKNDDTKHLTVMDKDGKDITAAATAVDEYLKMEKVQDFNTVASQNDLQLTFQVQSYSESMHAVYKENTLYQVNYTSGDEAEGEAPGMTLIEDGEAFTVPAQNHHLYLDGQTLRYWMDEDGNKYDLGQSYTLGQTFTASKDLPSGIAENGGFTVPKKDLFLTPVFKVNDFTVMNLSTTATAKWPLSRKGTASYEGNGDIVINFEGINGIYVTPLKLENGDFIDLKMGIRGENGKANNVNSTDRCQVNSGTIFGLPSSSNCTFTLKSANSSISAKIDGAAVEGQQTVSSDYTGDKTQIDVNFTGNTYLYEVVAQYKPVTTELPELDYATVGNISLGALGTPLANVKLSTLKSAGVVSGVPADLSNSTTGIMPVVRGTATRGGYVDVTQATIDNPVATMLVKTRDGVTVSVYKIEFTVNYPNIAPRVTDLKIDRKYQCDLQKMYEKAIEDIRVDGTNYINDNAYLRHLGVDGENAENERVAINGVINIKFSTKMAETVLPASTFTPKNGKATLGQAVYALEGQTLTFTYKGLDVDTEYDFIIPAGTFKDVFWADAAVKTNHLYNEDIRIHFTTVKTAISTERRVINYVVTHNQASHFDATAAKMVADGEPVQVASNELIKNLKDAGIPYGTLDRGVELANAYKEAGKRFYIFVPDGEYQLMGNDVVKSVSSPIGEDGKTMTLGKTENVYSGITTVSRDNVSITGQSQEKTIVYNHPAFEGLSNASTLKLNSGIANFYAQDMTLQNQFDFLRCRKVSSKGVAPALWDRSQKAIFKNVKFDSYQDTYYTNANSQFDDTRGYAEDCTIMGYVDFVCGDGDHWFQNSNMVVRQGVGSTATNMFAPRQYDTQKWGYVMNKCTFSAENNTAFDVNNGKMTIARPWANSPAETLIECKYDVLSTDDGYKKGTGTSANLVLRMQEYKSYNSDGTILDLSKRSLRNSTPAVGSWDAVMTPSKAAEYNLFDVMGGEDGYDPTLYTAQVNMPKSNGIKQDDTSLTWDDQKEALCYFIFRKDNESDTEWKLFAVTKDTEFEMDDNQIDRWFCVRAANQRGGLGEATDAFQYKAHKSYKRALVSNTQVIDGWRWSTIYLDFNAKAPIVQHEENVNGEMKITDDIFVYALVKVDATKLTFKRVRTMEKNCGYLIKARPRPEDYEFKYTEKTPVYYKNDTTLVQYRATHGLSEEKMPKMSLMNGSAVDRSTTGIAGYTLASKTSYGLGFYKYTGKTYNANFAWLDAAYVAEAQKALSEGLTNGMDPNEVKAAMSGYMKMVFDDDIDLDDNNDDEIDPGIATDIRDYQSCDDDVIYNLSGQRINRAHMQRGYVYIINGKKVRYLGAN